LTTGFLKACGFEVPQKRLGPHLILPFDTGPSKMGLFEGKTGQNVSKSEVEIRPVSIDNSSCVHLRVILGFRIKSQLLYQLSYRGNRTASRVAAHARFVKPGMANSYLEGIFVPAPSTAGKKGGEVGTLYGA
jgi:hypothetical protein